MEHLPDLEQFGKGVQMSGFETDDRQIGSPFTCYLIGRDSFLIPCGEVLLARNCQILGIISTGESIASWANNYNIPWIEPTDNIYKFLSQEPFDYLFSISNSLILTQEIIDLPKRGAINCHDALLPKYGGLNAPAWAIFYRESIHGVTWHRVTTQIDGGDLLKQGSFQLDDDETTLSLSVRCYEEILRLFEILVEELVTDRVTIARQNLALRSYFGRKHKPTPGCILPWSWSAERIDAMVRSLTFGDYENSIGLPKLAIGNQIIIVTEVAVLDVRSQSLPGSIVEIGCSRLTVATVSNDLLLLAVKSANGETLSITDFIDRFELKVGNRLVDIEPDVACKISELETALVKHEPFWVARLAAIDPISIPFAKAGNRLINANVECQELSLSTGLDEAHFNNFTLIIIIAFLSRLLRQNSFDIGMSFDWLAEKLAGLPDLWTDVVPVRFDLDSSLSFMQNFESIERQLGEINRRQTYARDLVLRYPELKALSKVPVSERLPVEIVIVKRLEDYLGKINGLTFVVTNDGNRACCYYQTAAIEPESVTAMLAQLNIFSERVVRNRHRAISELSLVSDRDLERIWLEWNATDRPYPTNKCIHHLFEERANLNPDAIAVRLEDKYLTYAQLNQRANRLARYLQTLGVKPDAMVGISVERSIEMVVGILGILKAGGAYVPLDPTYPSERLELMITDTEIEIVLTASRSIDRLPPSQAKLIFLDRDLADVDALSGDNLTTPVNPHHLAYVIYTSGSTGIPKGVAIEHRSLVNYATAIAGEFAVSTVDKILQFASLNFDISVEEIFTCLVAGATLVLRTADTLNIDTFFRHCQEWQITIASLPTAYWHELTLGLERNPLALPAELRLVLIGGERVAAARFNSWQQLVGNKVRLINTYGPTETTVSALWSDLSDLASGAEIPIGKPLPNVRAYILDPDCQPVPIGVLGELYIAGVGVARGYHNRPELNTTKFSTHSFESRTERLYATGDLVRYRPDGNIDFLGRIDRQVKIRGFRIELGEIEAILDRHPDIAQTVVTVREDLPGNKQLVAYCVPMHGQPPAIDSAKRTLLVLTHTTRREPPSRCVAGETHAVGERSETCRQTETSARFHPLRERVRDFIARQVPDYLVPTQFVLLPELPLSPNGKVDLRALPVPESTRADGADNLALPQDEIERALLTIWQQVGLQATSVRDNFFELGGHSLLAVYLFNEIEKKWGIKLSLSTLFSAGTIEKLAVLLRQDLPATIYSSLVLIRSGATDRQASRKENRPPLFCIHPIGGNVLEYYPLANCLSDRHTIYGLQSQGLDGRQPPLECLEDMARVYIQEMSAVQPAGAPYYLLGYSLGGKLAFEIAQQLLARGDRVQFLGLIDCSSPNLQLLRPAWHQAILIHLRNIWKLRPTERWKYILDRIKYQFNNKVEYRELLIKEMSNYAPIAPELLNIIDRNLQAELNYRARPYPGDIALFRCQVQLLENSLYPDLGWGELVGGRLQIYDIDGSHYGALRDPDTNGIAAKIDRCLTDKMFNPSC
ncbi:amino acid adenylation domain-containing protein [Chamaesiphon minutus]|uniref:Amino acid adenylation enzyme/thioester reductase family protein n=1 Tax=Chamaesiphon minutus (strain ATCC 27169 / PCC 6605) TaxID=1173020 RepID=K9UKV3_CHAP6|nr:amino acid adenylation domain-containing protein [Chamaesiphon minutus]AFY95268.1 amino acid adenylation enzyme/thioester reductase family protein [Chamaesiphon minutus PCC 6605]